MHEIINAAHVKTQIFLVQIKILYPIIKKNSKNSKIKKNHWVVSEKNASQMDVHKDGWEQFT